MKHTKEPKRGRPLKKAGEMKFKDFRRAGMVISAYDELRLKNEKHSVAVKEAVEVLTKGHPDMRISDTGVRRILAAYRPRVSRTTILFEPSIVTETGRERLRRMLEQVPEPQLFYLQKRRYRSWRSGIEHFLLGRLKTTQAFLRLDMIPATPLVIPRA
jgi:hypothetical protein